MVERSGDSELDWNGEDQEEQIKCVCGNVWCPDRTGDRQTHDQRGDGDADYGVISSSQQLRSLSGVTIVYRTFGFYTVGVRRGLINRVSGILHCC